ncbi:MAG: ESPR domain-containing protein, partial [Rhodocyclaceae bacterium]|nr:ESPR domain-containing protein [Rhodocyclaceae bacterium]
MNKHRYRLIFNRHRGVLMAVCESALGGFGGGSRGEAGRGVSRRRLPVLTALAAALSVLPGLAPAQIVADRAAPGQQQATVLEAGGVPLVN